MTRLSPKRIPSRGRRYASPSTSCTRPPTFLSVMIAPPFVMEEAVKSDDYTSFVDALYRYYFKEEHYPVEDAREVFDLWAKRVKGFVDRVAAQSKLDIMKTKGCTREEGLGGCPGA